MHEEDSQENSDSDETVNEEKINDKQLAQLFIILTNRRWINKRLQIGASITKLTDSFNMSEFELDVLITRLKEKIEPLGLEIVSFDYNDEEWICIRSKYPSPTELTSNQSIVLGIIIYLIKKGENDGIKASEVKKYLLTRSFMKKTEVNRILLELKRLGYIYDESSLIKLGARTLVEFDEISLNEIKEIAESLMY